jgi:DNA (cytosine-5)-methyltransferase 1
MNEPNFYPTPRTTSLCGGSGSYDAVQALLMGGRITDEEARAMTSTHGQLNPDWVEWLMGWPVGHSDVDRADPGPLLPLPDDPADLAPDDPLYLPRITERRRHRTNRIRALGNGQVPLCAAVAFAEGLATIEAYRRNLETERLP